MRWAVVIVGAVHLVTGLSAAQDQPAGAGPYGAILGTWDVVIKEPMRNVVSVIEFATENGELTATESLTGSASEVVYADGIVSFLLEADGRKQRVEAEVTGDTLEGKVFVLGASFCNFDEMYMLTGTRRPPVEGDRAAITEVINRWAETCAAKDLDAMLALFSEDYHDDILDSKEKVRSYWQLAMENGMTEGMSVGFKPSEITITGDTARTGRVYYQAKPGGFFQILELKKEADGVWRITKSYS
jgi:ketosteroid isomerase-like protein